MKPENKIETNCIMFGHLEELICEGLQFAGDGGGWGMKVSLGGFVNLNNEKFNSNTFPMSIHFLIHHFRTVPSLKKLQTTTEMWLLKDFKIQIA